MNIKETNARMLDPNRFKIAKQNAVIPGGPENNNPMNVTDNASPSITAHSIYGDYAQNYPQMGTGMVNPNAVNNSGQLQQFASGQRLNSGAPYGLQGQPDSKAEEAFEGARLGMEAQSRGLNTSEYMGIVGLPAQPAPGGVLPTPQQTPTTLGLQGNQSAEVPPKGMDMRSGKRS